MPAPADPTFRKSLTEADIRAAKDDALGALAGQARDFGAEPLPAAMERFVEPVLEKVIRDHDELLRKGIDPNEAPSHKRVDGVERKELGTYDAATDTFTPNAAGRKVLAERAAARPATLNEKALALMCRKTKDLPEFEPIRRAWVALQMRAMPDDVRRMSRNLILEKLMQEYGKRFGDPRLEVQALERGEAAHG